MDQLIEKPDDIYANIQDLRDKGVSFNHMDTGDDFELISDKVFLTFLDLMYKILSFNP